MQSTQQPIEQIDLATLTTRDLQEDSQAQLDEYFLGSYRKFDSKGLRDISEEIATKYYYRKTITWKTVIYVILFFLTAATLGVYIVELTKRIEIVINLDPKCYDETGFCSVPFVVTAQVDHRWRLWLRRINGNYFEVPLDIKWRTNQQSQGKVLDQQEAASCFPFITNRDMNVTRSKNGTPLDPDAIASPCGLVARDFPYEKYSVKSLNNESISIKQYVYPSTYSLINYPPNSQSFQWIDLKDSHYAAWATFNYDEIQYGEINFLKPGNYTLQIKRRGQNRRIRQGSIVLRSYWKFRDFNYYMLIFLILTWLGPVTGELYVVIRWLQLRKKPQETQQD